MIPDIVKELSDCLEKVANNDPDLHELKPLKQKAVEAVHSVLVGGNLCLGCGSDRREYALNHSSRWPVSWTTSSVYGNLCNHSTFLTREARTPEKGPRKPSC